VTIQTFEDVTALAAALAARVLAAIEHQPSLVLGLPTGRTPRPFYAALREQSQQRGTDWSRVRTFNLDEFVGLPSGAAGSYRAYMQRELFDAVRVPSASIGFLNGEASDVDGECARYEQAIAAAGGIDLMILGIGTNGHIGFNEPGPSLEPRTHRVRLLPASRVGNLAWFGDELARVPTEALSMGMATILQARAVVLMATGAKKVPAVEGMLRGPITTDLPASFLHVHPDVTVMLDREASPR
jgi:glucosamine-6-phosphate deaminase